MSKSDLMLKVPDPRQPPRMSSEEWIKLKQNKWLSAYILETARSIARKNEELFEDLVQEAWLRIDLNMADLTLDYYAKEAYRAMHNYYKTEWRQWRLTRRSWSTEPAFRRARKVIKKYKKETIEEYLPSKKTIRKIYRAGEHISIGTITRNGLRETIPDWIVSVEREKIPDNALEIIDNLNNNDSLKLLMFLNKISYKNYLKTNYWKVISGEMKKRQGSCFYCHSGNSFHVHHKTYEHRGIEYKHWQDLIVVCEYHHWLLHEQEKLAEVRKKKKKNGVIGTPKSK